MDVRYTKNVSFVLDVKIVIKTVVSALKRECISGEGTATMGEFLGKEDE